jgi:hypothetical protein
MQASGSPKAGRRGLGKEADICRNRGSAFIQKDAKRQSQTVAEFQKKVVCTKNPAAWKQKEAISKRKGKQKSAMSTKVHKAEKVERCKETGNTENAKSA